VPGPVRHVALNAAYLDPGRSGGPETYLRGLVPALAREFPRTRLTVLTTRRGAASLVQDGWRSFCDVVALPADEGQRPRRLAAELLLTADAAGRRGVDVLHSLASVGPPLARPAKVVTLHDVTFLRIRTFGLATTAAMGTLMLAAAHTADGLLSVSRTARDDIAATLRLDPGAIAVVPNGFGRPPSGDVADAGDVLARVGVPAGRRIALCVAAVRPHKNQELLVRALPHLPDDVVVVLCGAQEAYADTVAAVAAELGVQDRLRLPGYLEDAELEALWRLAGCAALPTLAEGFGLPVLEALVRGVPLACSDLPELREVGGELPRYFDPRDPASAAAAITAAMTGPFDAAAARARAGGFTWEAAARSTFEVYERAVAAHAG
jgi:glycosyltransferase involved in cell wall biosynthesis